MSADIYLKDGESGGVLGRLNDVGSGYGTAPKGYILEMNDRGLCRLIVSRGKKNKNVPDGDAEQQAFLRAHKDAHPGGELVLNSVQLTSIHAGTWHTLKLVFKGSTIIGLVDGRQVLTAADSLYATGMAGLMAGGDEKALSTPFYDNLLIQKEDGSVPPATSPQPGQSAIYPPARNNASRPR